MGIEKQQARYETKKVSETKYEVEDGSVLERLVDNDPHWTLSKDSIHTDTDAFVNDLAERHGINIEH